jgi:hypothetical protein
MSTQAELEFEQPGADADLLSQLMQRADQILIKKLSNNDREWAHDKLDHDGNVVRGKRKNNQAGFYVHQEQRDSGFFPPLELKEREDGESEIRHCYITTVWPQVDQQKTSHLIHYTSKGSETHLTTLPREVFIDLLPASFVVMGRVRTAAGVEYECLTIDSGSDEAALLADLFDIGPDFEINIFIPASVLALQRSRILDFADQVIAAWTKGQIADFARDNATMPVTAELARMAQEKYRTDHRIATLDPFALPNPGDVLRDISRRIEWDIFRDYQRRERSVELVRIVLGDSPRALKPSDIIRALVDDYARIDGLMLSASQQRKSRAGYSYEHHIEAMLIGGGIPFQKQVIVEAKKRPDFILPSRRWVESGRPDASSGLILSAKTTLRERWKQVEREMKGRRLFLTTVDENIAGNAIEDMASIGIHLVVPESLLEDEAAEYSRHKNVLGFRDFCDSVIAPNLAAWKK